ncbi:MAG: glycogen-binding domain-containing protein [Treponema sp.]|jgi:hypothetical protein|nr:glycogen-binding domain-containing protein [Treponema sp.]
MKKAIVITLLTAIIGTLEAAGNSGFAEAESLPIMDYLLGLREAEKPHVIDDTVIFTVPSTYRRVGIAFGHEGFGKVYWFRRLMVPNEDAGPWIKNKPPANQFRDSGMLFYVFTVPEDLSGELEYRLIVDGLWTRDPLNPQSRLDNTSGIVRSVVSLPPIKRPDSPNRGPAGALTFTYQAPPGELVTVAGSFNNWDPFMYELREVSPGRYSLSLPLPAGAYQYVFFHRGERRLDPNNPRRLYTRDGKPANEAAVE